MCLREWVKNNEVFEIYKFRSMTQEKKNSDGTRQNEPAE